MNWIIGTKEEYESLGHTLTTERKIKIDRPLENGILEDVYIKHTNLNDELSLGMNRINKYNIISSEELNYLLPVDES